MPQKLRPRFIASLRSQVTDLFTQVTQLNSKLVASYDRVSDIEDQLHEALSSLRKFLERAEHLAALNTGLLVEKAHVTAELNRLMERATEEAAQRGQAESARHDIEKDLDDLSATLFDQANTMVAEARLNQARSERKVREAEEALKSAEEAVKVMQGQLQALEADKAAAEREATGALVTMSKGKWVERRDSKGGVPKLRFLTTHTPYAEFAAFVAYLRTLRPSQMTSPTISSLLNQPFLARLNTEDSEPTVRLDLAPSLNWLSRRSVLAAIHTGMLTVEPMPFLNLVQELSSQSQAIATVSCSLCGTHIARLTPGIAHEKPPIHPLAALTRSSSANSNSWFKYPLALSSSTHGSETSSHPPPPLASVLSKQASSHTALASSRPPAHSSTTSRVLPAQSNNSPHPLCTSNYCLLRLRTTCSLWAFRIWQEEVAQLPSADGTTINGNGQLTLPNARRLWEMASALGEKAASWGKDGGESPKLKDREKEDIAPKCLPPPPPSHPSVPHPHVEPTQPTTQVPPTLPKRSEMRTDTSEGGSDNNTVPNAEPAVIDNTIVDPEHKDNHTSSESTGSPAPLQVAPPVPRRAPARRAVPLPPPTSMSERSITLTTRLKREGTKKSKESESSKEVETPKMVVALTTANREDGGGCEPSSMSSNELPEDGNTPAGPSTEPASSPSKRQTSALPELVNAQPEPPTTTTAAATDDSSVTENSSSTQITESNGGSSIDTEKHIDTEGCASDGTWEERTWKEVVRLREEMFWARVGCVREL
ncbi:hypothetical protein F5141DRAFT_1187545 [Pisolithus sp. B1]|nr:hypothetical protein F5141DRAFT_1187545 [Pisolithus sp. B1]